MVRILRWLLFLLIVLVAFGLRLWHIDRLPPGFHFDEAFEGQEAWRILTDATYRPIFLTGNFGVPPLNAYANALTFALFHFFGGEAGPTAMRVTAACFGGLGVLALFGLASELGQWERPRSGLSSAFPLFSAAALAVMGWHIHFSRMGIEPILVPLLWTGATWLFLHSWRTGVWLGFAGSGILLAAGMYAYQSAWVIPFLMIPLVLYLLRLDHRAQKLTGESQASITNQLRLRRRWGLLLTAGVAFLFFLPLGWFFWQHQALLLLRPTQIAIVGATNLPAQATFWGNVWATVKMFAPVDGVGDLDPRRNLPGAPALNGWLGLPFYLGGLLAFWRIRRPAYAVTLLGWVGLLLPGMLSEYAPHFHRLLGAAAPTALLCAFGLDALWQGSAIFNRQAPKRHWAALSPALALVLLLSAGMTSVRDYFVRWAALPDLFYAFDVGLWQVGQAIAAAPADTPIYLTPRSADHPTLAFALQTAPHPRKPPIAFDGRHIFPLTAAVSAQPEQYVVIETEDFRTRLLLPELFPNAPKTLTVRDGQGQPYADVYLRPPAAKPQRLPQTRLTTVLGDGISLQGYDLQPATLQPGAPLYLQLHWLVQASPTGDWTVFTHVVATDAAGGRKVVAGFDSQPGAGSLVTTRWQAGWRILDEYQVNLPADLPIGEYQLAIGLYQANGAHLPNNADGIVLGKIQVKQ